METAKPDPVFNVLVKFKEDRDQNKVNLSVGAYRNEEGLPWVLPVVRTVEAQMSTDLMLNHEYLPLDGLKAFTDSATKLLLGGDSPAITQNRFCAFQAISGTGSVRVGLQFLNKFLQTDTIYLSKPTWSNHHGIARDTGFANIKEYRYYNPDTKALDIEGMIADLTCAPENCVVVLHTCAHNPTGVDPNRDQWLRIINVIKERKLFPLMDTAYLGFATGDVDNDAWPVREMVRQGMELFIAQSFAKNFGLYNERVGQLCCVLSSPEVSSAVLSQLKFIGRRVWSNCPHHGARIVATALNNPTLYQEWIDNLTVMTDRIKDMREGLFQRLKAKGTPGNWDHIVNQIGMFSYTGLNGDQVEYLTKKYHIYLLSSGRINISGLNHGNLDYVAGAIHDTVTNIK